MSSYHAWQNIWSEKLVLRVTGENKDNLYRAYAISLPLHQGFPTDDRHEIPYSGFVAAVSILGGDTRVLPMNKIQWVSKLG